jgi:hypothetical protein
MTSPNPTPPNNVAQAPSTTVASNRSSATAIKGTPQGPPPIASSTPVLPPTPDSHGNAPLNGKPANMSASGAPAIVSSSSIPTGPTGDHTRRTSSVTISAQGTPPYLPNGNATAPKPNIAFGSMNATGSPAIANSVPHIQNATLTPQANSRHGTRTPSPIAHPPVSGGRPPSGPQGQGRELTFGNLPGAEGGDQSVCRSFFILMSLLICTRCANRFLKAQHTQNTTVEDLRLLHTVKCPDLVLTQVEDVVIHLPTQVPTWATLLRLDTVPLQIWLQETWLKCHRFNHKLCVLQAQIRPTRRTAVQPSLLRLLCSSRTWQTVRKWDTIPST